MLRWISSHGARITAVERVVYLGSIGLNHENTPAIAIGQGIPSDGGWIDKLTIHESQSIGKPLFHVVDLTLIRPSVGATRSLIPTLKVAYLGFGKLGCHGIHHSMRSRITEKRCSEFLIAINVALPEIEIPKQIVPPGVVEKISAAISGSTSPDQGVVVAPIGGSQGTIKVPNGSEGQFAASGLVKVAAESKGIDIEGDDIEQMVINGCIDIEQSCIAGIAVGQSRSRKRPAEILKEALNIFLLRVSFRAFDCHFLGVDVSNGPPSSIESGIAGIRTVNLENIPATDGWFLAMLRK